MPGNRIARAAYPEHHERGFDLCASARMSKGMALVMARGFANRGYADAAEGCAHYALRIAAGNGNRIRNDPETERG